MWFANWNSHRKSYFWDLFGLLIIRLLCSITSPDVWLILPLQLASVLPHAFSMCCIRHDEATPSHTWAGMIFPICRAESVWMIHQLSHVTVFCLFTCRLSLKGELCRPSSGAQDVFLHVKEPKSLVLLFRLKRWIITVCDGGCYKSLCTCLFYLYPFVSSHKASRATQIQTSLFVSLPHCRVKLLAASMTPLTVGSMRL